MAEDWNAIASEVDAAIKYVADVGQPGGYPATLRVPPVGESENPWDPPAGDPVDHTVFVIEGVREIKDVNGTTVLTTLRTLTISAAGQAPAKGQQVAVGVKAEDVTAETVWNEIGEVRPLSPVGIAVLYEVDLLV